MKLAGNTVLITGASSGIGYAMAEAFLNAGSTVIACARGMGRLVEAQRRHPGLHIQTCDIADERSRIELAAMVNTRFPELNVLVNNAGVQRDIDLTHGPYEFLAGDNEIRINLEGPIVLTAMLVPLLAKNAAPALINVSSGLGFVPMASMPVYCASKAGMHAFTLAMRAQLAKRDVKVFEIVPPMVDTALNPGGRAKRGGFRANLSAEAFVAAVMKELAADTPEIGYGMTAGYVRASRAELDRRFAEINAAFITP
jgi:uncharacterized oxidoreductase